MAKPYQKDYLNLIYNQLFCDNPSLYQSAETSANDYPWDIILHQHPSADELLRITADTKLESRIKLLAYRKLQSAGKPVMEKILLGVIIEVGLENGLDTLAAYADGTARLIGHAENLIVWEHPDTESREIIAQLFRNGDSVVSRIGPWTGARPAFPASGDIRLNFLVADGYYFGQGPFNILQGDAMGGPVIESATALFSYLVNKGLA